MKEMMPLANPDVLNEGTTDGGVNGTPDEAAFAAQQVGHYVKYQNAHLRFASTWDDPKKLRLSALPKVEGGAGGDGVLDDRLRSLFQYGGDKKQAAAYMDKLTHDERIWEHSVQGDPAKNETAVGQLPVYQTLWDEYAKQRPAWLTDWAIAIHDGLGAASGIHHETGDHPVQCRQSVLSGVSEGRRVGTRRRR